MRTIEIVEEKYGVVEFRENDEGKLEVKLDLSLPIPEGLIKFQGHLSAEEVSWNIQHSLMFLAMQGALPFQVVSDDGLAVHAPIDKSVN